MTRTTLRPTTPRGTALRAGASVAVLASGALLLLSACGSSSGSSSASSTTGTSASTSASASGKAGGSGVDAQAMSKYRDCLTQHGVTLPSFSPGAGRPSGAPSGRPSGRPSGSGGGGGGFGGYGGFGGASADPKTAAAMKACDSLRPQFNGQRGGAGGMDSTALKAFTSCLKDHGVTLPTPSPGATGSRAGGSGGTRGLNTSDPKTAKAYNTCKALLPQRPSGAPTSTPS